MKAAPTIANLIRKEPFSSIPQDQFQALVDESLLHGFNELERLQREQADGSNTFDRPGQANFTHALIL